MNKAWLTGAALVATTCLAVNWVATTPAADDASRIRALEAEYAAAIRARDVDAIMKVYLPTEDLFIFEVVPPRQFVGATSYREHTQGFVEAFPHPIEFEIYDLSVTVVGNVGYGHSMQRLIAVDAGGNNVDMNIRVTDVYRKVKGIWYIVQEHASVPVLPDTGKADFSSKR